MKKLFIACACIVAALIAYVAWDQGVARGTVAKICRQAEQGMALNDFLARVDQNEFTVAHGQQRTFIVARSGMGRHNCAIAHDGTKIVRAAAGFLD